MSGFFIDAKNGNDCWNLRIETRFRTCSSKKTRQKIYICFFFFNSGKFQSKFLNHSNWSRKKSNQTISILKLNTKYIISNEFECSKICWGWFNNKLKQLIRLIFGFCTSSHCSNERKKRNKVKPSKINIWQFTI